MGTYIAAAFVVGMIASGLGCDPPYDHMKSERQIASLAPLVRRTAALPRHTLRAPTTRPGEPTVGVAVCRTGNPNARGPILVFLHGLFSDADAWRYVVGSLGDEYTTWLIDLPGCGASDKPDLHELLPDGYGPDALAERVCQAIAQALSREPADRRIVLVGHSLGSTIAMRLLASPTLRERYAAVRRRIEGLVLITPLDVAIEKPIPVLEYIARVGDGTVELANALGIVRDRMAQSMLDGTDDPSTASREEVDRGIRILVDSRTRHALQGMILQATPRRSGESRPDWPKVDRLVSEYANIDVPVRITCGAHDESLPASMSYRLAAEIRGAKLEVLPDCMHSPQLECPTECAQIIRRFVSGLPHEPAVAVTRSGDAGR